MTAPRRAAARSGRAAAVARRPEPLEQRIESHLAELLPEYPRVSLCCAFSGGLDSTVLLTALALRAGRGTWPQLRAVHVDHGLNPRSGAWAEQCSHSARRLHVPLTIVRADVHRPRGASLEAAAREARYAALAAQLREAEILLTAQHADDQLETVLLQLLRGAGLRGLAAMPAAAPFARGWLVRPLLPFERSELARWARERRLAWVEDPTNADERLDRNYLRHRIVPLLRARWPAAGRALSRSAHHAAEAQRLLDLLARADCDRAAVGEALSIKRLRALTPERRRNALRYWIVRRGGPLPDARRLAEISGPMIAARRDAHPEVAWGGRVARREGDRLSLASRDRAGPRGGPRGANADAPVGLARLDPPGTVDVSAVPDVQAVLDVPVVLDVPAGVDLPGGAGRLELAPDIHGPVDLDALPRPLSVRLRRGGERLRLRSGGPSRALKALLQEARVPRAARERMPLLWCGERLLAAGDLWVDASIRAGRHTKRRARLVWHSDVHIC